MMAHPVSSADRTPRSTPTAPSEPAQNMAHPMTPDETAVITPNTTADRNRSGLPQVSSRRSLSGRNAATLAVAGFVGIAAGTTAAALYVDANSHHAPAPITQEGQAPTQDALLKITNPNTPETQVGNPTIEIQKMLQANVNEFYEGTISLENPTFTTVDPDHPNNQQNVGLSQVEELCGTSIPPDSHLNLELTNALISSNKTDGTIIIVMDGIVGDKRVILKVPWSPQTVKTVKQGFFVNTKITDFVDGDPVVSDEHGKPTAANQLDANIIGDQPNPAPIEP